MMPLNLSGNLQVNPETGNNAQVTATGRPIPSDTGSVENSMLILTRRVGETLMIGEQISVTVLGVKGNQVRIGINAPQDVAVHREEIFERIQRENHSGDVGEGDETKASGS